jgi:hypothetical protein
VFHELQPAVVDALNEISIWKDTETKRLKGLAVLNIHQDIYVDTSMIIDKMAITSKRRLNINL